MGVVQGRSDYLDHGVVAVSNVSASVGSHSQISDKDRTYELPDGNIITVFHRAGTCVRRGGPSASLVSMTREISQTLALVLDVN